MFWDTKAGLAVEIVAGLLVIVGVSLGCAWLLL